MFEKLKAMDEELRNVLIISISVLVIIVLFFWITAVRLNQPYEIRVPEFTINNEIKFDKILIGEMFNLPEENYFVYVRDENNPNDMLFESLVATNDLGYRHYEANLNSFFNYHFLAEESNQDKNNLQFKTSTILLIKDNQIVEFLEEKDEVLNYFVSKEEENE